MSRLEGNKGSQVIATPDTVLFTLEERIAFIAELIVNRIAEDERDGFLLLEKIKGDNESR